jgi:hypothetical protein
LLCDCGCSLISEFDTSQDSEGAGDHPPAEEAPKSPPDSFLRLARSWLLLPVVTYPFSFATLGAGAFFVPIVIFNAPLGILGYFEPITVNPTPQQQTAIVVIHAVFWLLFITGISLRRVLALPWLWSIWLVLVAALFMSISGCASQLGPGLRNSGNWH